MTLLSYAKGLWTALLPAATKAKMENIEDGIKAASDILDLETDAGRALTQAADAEAQRSALGLGDSATKNVGTGAGDVAAGNAPAGAVTTHESTYAHTNLPTAAGKTAADAIGAASGADTAEKLRTLLPEVNEIDDVQLAVARTIRDVNELERTIQQGQSATIDQDDIGTVSLDARATGRANPTVEGLTATNLVGNGDFSAGTTGWYAGNATIAVSSNVLSCTANGTSEEGLVSHNFPSVIKSGEKYAFIFKVRVTNSSALSIILQVRDGSGVSSAYTITTPVENQWYTVAVIYTINTDYSTPYFRFRHSYADATTANGKVMEIDGNYGVTAINLTSIYGAGNEPSEADCAKIFSYFDGTKSIQLPARIISKSEDETESSTLYIADNEELRSVQAVSDTVSVINGEHMLTKKISTPVSVASGVAVNVTNYPTAKTGGKFAVELTAGGTQIGIIGTDSTSGAGTLRFELATPVTTNLLTSGILQAKPKGTVYFEPYYEGSHQTNADGEITLPFTGTVEAVYGYDAQMVEYLLDPSEYALVGTTLTITGALLNEVFYVELSRTEPLAPEMNVNVLNNLVVPTTVNAATYTVLDGDHTLLVAYTPTGTCAITIPSALIANYVRLTIKDSGGSANINNITISTQGSEKIDGADTYVINSAKGKVELASDGANLYVVG